MRNSRKSLNSWTEINLNAILSNKHLIESRLPKGCKFCAVIKADAYGHGALRVSKELEKDGVDYFGVANINEAISLRNSGIATPIIILGYTNPIFVDSLIKYDLTQTCFSKVYAEQLLENLHLKDKLRLHIKINSGMNRIGFNVSDESVNEVLIICKNPRFDVEGIFTHFYGADTRKGVHEQFKLFSNFIKLVEESGFKFKIKHCCNSAATINYPEYNMDMVRVGASLYGINVTDKIKVEEAMSLKSRIVQIFDAKPGDSISYGGRFVVDKKMKVAVICVGYADGVRRSNFDKLFVTIGKKKCKVLGTICMDQLMVDVSNVKCKENQEVVVFGRGGESIEKVAENNSTIAYEIMCSILPRAKRIYK